MKDTILPEGGFRGAPIPWWGKILAKLVLSRLPLPHSAWTKFNVFRHSYSSRDAASVVAAARARVDLYVAKVGRLPTTILELGPGEVTTCGVVYRALGVKRTIFADVGDFGLFDAAAYREVAEAAEHCGLAPPDLSDASTRAEVFERCGVDYLTGGLADLREIPARAADFVTSVAVLEHVRLDQMGPTLTELRRIMADHAIAWHFIDFQDHLGGGLRNLHFSERIWESRWMSQSGFYTNRISPSRMIELMKSCGLAVEIESRGIRTKSPIERRHIDRELSRTWTDEDVYVGSLGLLGRVGTSRPS